MHLAKEHDTVSLTTAQNRNAISESIGVLKAVMPSTTIAATIQQNYTLGQVSDVKYL